MNVKFSHKNNCLASQKKKKKRKKEKKSKNKHKKEYRGRQSLQSVTIKPSNVVVLVLLGLFTLRHHMKLWHFSSSVNSFFKHTCSAIQWGPFVYRRNSCVRTVKALARLRECAEPHEPSLVAYVKSTIILWAGSYGFVVSVRKIFSRTLWFGICVFYVIYFHLINPYKPTVPFLGKQCRPRSDAAERGVWSGSPLFAYRIFYSK